MRIIIDKVVENEYYLVVIEWNAASDIQYTLSSS